PLYMKSIEVGGAGDAARDAALRLSRLLEQTGKTSEALEAWKTLSDRFGEKLSDAEKKEAHEAIGRLLPPGGHARSPLGEVFVRPLAGTAAAPESPLTTKVLAMIALYAEATGEARHTLRIE